VFDNIGPERIIFGSDVSGTVEPFFNFPKVELKKIEILNLDENSKRLILSKNIEQLVPGY
jgi:predicted TIM-barrel fold metal-dependent hydrolase